MAQHPITLVTVDRFLEQLIMLELSDGHRTVRVLTDPTAADTVGMRLIDLDSFPTVPLTPSDIALSRIQTDGRFQAQERRLSVPFPVGALNRMLDELERLPHAALTRTKDGVLYRGEHIALTATEYAIAAALIDAQGAYVPRAKLVSLMGDGASDNALSVYIHYLRRKLETDGVKVITSSRKDGYRIEPAWFEKR